MIRSTSFLIDNVHELTSCDEIDACNDDLNVVITKVTIDNKHPTKNYMISLVELFELNQSKLDKKNCCK